jgi:hypothetical protein
MPLSEAQETRIISTTVIMLSQLERKHSGELPVQGAQDEVETAVSVI